MKTTWASAISSRSSRFTTAPSKTSPRWMPRPSTPSSPSGAAATCLFRSCSTPSKGSHGATIAAFEIHSFPTTILIDPQGKLVGQVSPETLEEKLTPIPMAQRIPARSRSRRGSGYGRRISSPPSSEFLRRGKLTSRSSSTSPRSKTAGIDADAPTNLKLSGSLSLRSWLELLLDPLGLEAVPGTEALTIVPAKRHKTRELSEPQKRCAARIEQVLDQKVSFDFKDATLTQVAAHFEGKTQENFVLDPAGRQAKLIDPEATVTGSAKNVPLAPGARAAIKAARPGARRERRGRRDRQTGLALIRDRGKRPARAVCDVV